MLTARGEETDRIVGLEVGADDYVLKPFSARELVARIRAVLRRARPPEAPAGEEPLEVGDVQLDPARHEVTQSGRPIELTRKEFELLRLLMRNAGAVVSREQLIEDVWDVNWFGPTKTLDVHVSALRKKLGDDPAAPRYVHTVRGVGFRFAAPAELARRPAVSLRGRLLAAFAYVLVLTIVALEVPLALNISRRVDAEVKSEAASGAQVVASSAAGSLGRTEELERLSRRGRPSTSEGG